MPIHEQVLKHLPTAGAVGLGGLNAYANWEQKKDVRGQPLSKKQRAARAAGGALGGGLTGYILGSVPGAFTNANKAIMDAGGRRLRKVKAKGSLPERVSKAATELASRHARHLSGGAPTGRPFFPQRGDLTKMNCALSSPLFQELHSIIMES